MAAAAGGAAAYATHWYIVDRGLSDEPAPPALCGWDRVDGYGRREIAIADTATMRLAGRDAAANPNNQIAAANSLCGLGRANRVDCAVVPQPGKHDWPFADQAFAAALPWLAGQLGTPGAPRIPLPATSAPSAPEPTAQIVPAGR